MTQSASPALVDTHCHLNFDVFDPDRKLVVERARQNGITRILVPGIDLETSRTALECADEFSIVYAAVGVHPNDGDSWNQSITSELRTLAVNNKVVAIGEIGLDYYRDSTPRALQLEILEHQLELAAELGLPVIIHNRLASEDLKRVLSEWHRSLVDRSSPLKESPGVLHSFSGDAAFAEQMIALNFSLGINGPVTFRSSQALQSLVASLPIEAILVETDAPFLTPQPFRGTRNEPANVRIVAEKISQLQGTSLEHVAAGTTAAASKLFSWRETH